MDKKSQYSIWFLFPAMSIFIIFFIIPMLMSLFFSMTVWNFDNYTFVGLDNFKYMFITYKFTCIIRFLGKYLKVLFLMTFSGTLPAIFLAYFIFLTFYIYFITFPNWSLFLLTHHFSIAIFLSIAPCSLIISQLHETQEERRPKCGHLTP